MDVQTGATILRILQKRVPWKPTAVRCTDVETYVIQSIDGVGRDLGDEFDHITINLDQRTSVSPEGARWDILWIDEIHQIIDPTDGALIFDATGR